MTQQTPPTDPETPPQPDGSPAPAPALAQQIATDTHRELAEMLPTLRTVPDRLDRMEERVRQWIADEMAVLRRDVLAAKSPTASGSSTTTKGGTPS